MNKNIYYMLAGVLIFAGCSSKGGVIAKVGGDKITLEAFEERVQSAPVAYRQYLTTPAGQKQFLDIIVREKLVLEAARKQGINKDKEYKDLMSKFKEEQKRMADEYKDNLLAELFIRKMHGKKISPSDEEVKKYYNDHEKEFKNPVSVTARHILLTDKEEAKKVLQRVKKGENFSKLAKEVSQDPVSAVKGGEIGPFTKGDLVPEFEDAVFKLKTGQISDIVETQFGFHIIKKLSARNLKSRSFEDSKEEIKRIVEKVKFDSWLEKMKEEYGVKIDYAMLEKISIPQEPSIVERKKAETNSEVK